MQCDADPLVEENARLKKENETLREKVRKLTWSVEKIRDDDKATKFYTGLPTFAVFLWLYK